MHQIKGEKSATIVSDGAYKADIHKIKGDTRILYIVFSQFFKSKFGRRRRPKEIDFMHLSLKCLGWPVG